MIRVREVHRKIFQCSREYAEAHGNEYKAVLGVCPTAVEGLTVPYFCHGVRDEDTPTFEDIEKWVGFMMPHLVKWKHEGDWPEDYEKYPGVLVHCEAGQNRSTIVASLLAVIEPNRGTTDWDKFVGEVHDRFLKCDPPHNWMPYEHWDKVIRVYLDDLNGVKRGSV